jgi:6-phosphogluconolactonase
MRKGYRRTVLTLTGLALALASWAAGAPAGPASFRVYIGTYTDGDSKGIYELTLDPATGGLGTPRLVAETSNPTFLVVDPKGTFLYAANEDGDSPADARGAISAFKIDPKDGTLAFLNSQPARGASPCHLVVDKAGRHLIVANYASGNVAVLPVGADGRLGVPGAVIQHEGHGPKPNQGGPHAHSVVLDRANAFLFVSDLGLDKVVAYRFDVRTGELAPHPRGTVESAPGSGPRHFAFDPAGRHAYSLTEMGSTVTAYDYDPHQGRLTPTGTFSSLPEGFGGHSDAAEIAVRPDGAFVYSSNRGADDIAVFAVEKGGRSLRKVQSQPTGGRTPRNFSIDPTGHYLLVANQRSNSLVVFRIDVATGLLTAVGPPVAVPSPACVLILPEAAPPHP